MIAVCSVCGKTWGTGDARPIPDWMLRCSKCNHSDLRDEHVSLLSVEEAIAEIYAFVRAHKPGNHRKCKDNA